MNNDKRMILAIALYAAVITMILHTLSSEGHQRFNVTNETHVLYGGAIEATTTCTFPAAACDTQTSEWIQATSLQPETKCRESECIDAEVIVAG
jgi:hypothetical protein